MPALKTLHTEFTKVELAKLGHLISDLAADAEDDGREGCPDSKLLWRLQKVLYDETCRSTR